MNLQFHSSVTISRRQRMLVCVTIVGLLFGIAHMAFAQGASELTAVYGRGVHAFFTGNMARADELFTEVIQSGSQDPRVFYFRGLTRLQQYGDYEAEEDFRMGAMLEARDPGRRYAIGTALQRIQGSSRQTLERFRREGRLEKYQERRGQNQRRYEQLRTRESDVLHKDAPVLMKDLVLPSVERPVPGASTTPPAATKPAPAASEPAEAPKPVEQPSAAPEDDDPFGSSLDADEPAEVAKPVEQPTAAPEDDPFGSSPAQEEDPFGAPPKSESAPVPAEEPASDDLFGASTETDTPSTEAAEGDLFGDPSPAEPAPAPAEPSAADDLFGAESASDPGPAPAATEPTADDLFGSPSDSSSDVESNATEDAALTEEAVADPAPATSEDDPFGSSDESATVDPSDDPFGAPEEEMSEPDAGAASAYEETIDESVAHEEDAEATEDREAADAAVVTGSLEGEPAESDPFAQPEEDSAEADSGEADSAMEDPATEESSEGEQPAEDADSSSDSATEEAPPKESDSTEEEPKELAPEDDPFGDF